MSIESELLPTRQSLLSRLKDWGDQESWHDFFNTYWRLIYNVAIKAGLTEEEAQDVIQETIMSVAKTMPGFRYDPKVCSFKTWLQHLTRKRIVDQLRKRPPPGAQGRRLPSETARTPTVERIPVPGGSELDAIWEAQWQQAVLGSAMKTIKEKVNPRQYQMFYLYAIKQQPIQEVARSLRVPVSRVYLAKHRVSALIKKEVKRLETKCF
ncbi:MAG TPA: sigma-70 family RNA polymerase sigma factor [Verrucomicrobiae bacterium]|nr:sigma-70 family RNA polymerase sigma factor [Verrucomicrobiae bacterium]